VSAVPEEFMHELPKAPERARDEETRRSDDERGLQTFWQWFAVGVLIFCWIAEATLCAQRGF
jgi:hypothetical protein